MEASGENGMARYRRSEAAEGQGLFLSVQLEEQLLPGTFEHMLDHIIGTKIDTGIFDKKYKNDKTGASAISPVVLLKLIIYGYSIGRKSSREIWELNNENIVAKALTGNMSIHWTTIAEFISGNSEEFKEVFSEVIAYCHELELIGGKMFAIDGCRLPGNASKEMSGTREGLKKRLALYERMAAKHLSRHRRRDERGEMDAETRKKSLKQQKKLERQIEKMEKFLSEMKERRGQRGQEIQSNVTDNESALIRNAGGGYIQGYIGLAVADGKEQVIVSAAAVGSANECEHFPAMLGESLKNLPESGPEASEEEEQRTILADGNYFSEDNLEACAGHEIEGIIPDSQASRRRAPEEKKEFGRDDFEYHEGEDRYECPQGKKLTYNREVTLPGGKKGREYEARVEDCRACPWLTQCIQRKEATLTYGKRLRVEAQKKGNSLCHEMRKKLEGEEYKERYARRIQIIEPVFANIKYCKGLNRFTMRGQAKVNGQWLLWCIMHNLGKCLKGYMKRELEAWA
jgi:transposase